MDNNGGVKMENIKKAYASFSGVLLAQNMMASLISLIVYTFFAIFFSDSGLALSTAIFGGMILLMMSYTAAWRVGQKDYNKVKFDRTIYKPLKGLICGSLSQAPLLILLVAGLALEGSTPWLMVAYRFLFSSVLGIFDLAEISAVFYFIPLLFVPASAAVGYHLGYKRVSLSQRIMYKKSPDKPSGGGKRN